MHGDVHGEVHGKEVPDKMRGAECMAGITMRSLSGRPMQLNAIREVLGKVAIPPLVDHCPLCIAPLSWWFSKNCRLLITAEMSSRRPKPKVCLGDRVTPAAARGHIYKMSA